MKNRRLWVSIVAGLLALVMLLGILASVIPSDATTLTPGETYDRAQAPRNCAAVSDFAE